MSVVSKIYLQGLKDAQQQACALLESFGSLMTHLREGISDAEQDLEGGADLCASDALEVLSQMESEISSIQACVSKCIHFPKE
jgi:hypothetical protein